jgi:hypothetical protein
VEATSSAETRKPLRTTTQRGFENLERETGIEPATLSLGRDYEAEEDR